jgi:aminoglycoside phosphotransferase (APT) family kinase protein
MGKDKAKRRTRERPLLRLLERRTGTRELRYAEEPRRLRSRWALIFSFRLADPPAELDGDLVIRIMPDVELPEREMVIQASLTHLGFPVPRVRMTGDREAGLGRPFMIMDRAPGIPLGKSKEPRKGRVPILLADTMAALHAIDPRPVQEALANEGVPRESVGLDAFLADLEEGIDYLPLRGFREGLEWLHRHRPDTSRVAVCHGDLHATNILSVGDRVTAVLDWTNARIAHPAFDVAYASTIFSFFPLVGRRLAKRFLDAYRRHHPVETEVLRWYEALQCLGILTTVAAARLNPKTSPTPHVWQTRGRACAAHFQALTQIAVDLPSARPLLARFYEFLCVVQLAED